MVEAVVGADRPHEAHVRAPLDHCADQTARLLVCVVAEDDGVSVQVQGDVGSGDDERRAICTDVLSEDVGGSGPVEGERRALDLAGDADGPLLPLGGEAEEVAPRLREKC